MKVTNDISSKVASMRHVSCGEIIMLLILQRRRGKSTIKNGKLEEEELEARKNNKKGWKNRLQ